MSEGKHLLAKIGQYALIKNRDGQILMLQRARSKTWCLPGGRLNEGEQWDAALVRELNEELGIRLANPQPFAVNVITDQWQTKYCVYFMFENNDSQDIKLSEEHCDYKWVGIGDIDDLDIEDDKVRGVVKRAASNIAS